MTQPLLVPCPVADRDLNRFAANILNLLFINYARIKKICFINFDL